MTTAAVEVKNLSNYLGGQWIHKDLSFSVKRGEIVALIGGSGAGKTTLLRSLLQLHKINAGEISLLGINMLRSNPADIKALKRRIGVLFQQSALFSSLSVLDNVMFALHEFSQLSQPMQKQLACLKLALAGLPLATAEKFPAELSGGMLKRAALARALVLDPELIFLDEPTSGLDPQSALLFDELILKLRDALGLTIIMVSHDLTSLERITDNVAFIGEQKILAMQPYHELKQHQHPMIQNYFEGQG